MDVFRSEVKAGIMIFAAFAILIAGIFMIGGLRDLGKKRNYFTLLFQSTSGIKKNSPVWFEGYEIGQVIDIRLFESLPSEKIIPNAAVWARGKNIGKMAQAIKEEPYRDYIALTIKVDPRAHLKTDSKAVILPLGLMGEKVVKLSRGSPKAPPLRSGDVLIGQPSMTMEALFEEGKEITGSMKEIAKEAKATILEVKKLVHNFDKTYHVSEVIDNARDLLENLKQRSEDLGVLLNNVNGLVRDVRPRVVGTLDNLEHTTKEIDRTISEIRPSLRPLIKEINLLARQVRKDLKTITPKLDVLLGDVDKAVRDADPLLVEARGTIKNVDLLLVETQGAVKSLKGLLENADSLLDENRENIYFILYDLRQTSRHLKALIEDLREAPWKVIWKAEGKTGQVEWTRLDQEEWRTRGRIGRHEKE